MIIDFVRRLCIFTPPACATHTLHELLCAPPYGAQSVFGPSCGSLERLDRHTCLTPVEAEGFHRIVCIRHPYGRAVSLYLHDCRWRSGQGLPCESWRDWFERLAAGKIADRFFAWSIRDHFAGSGKMPARRIRVENLHSDLRGLGYPLPAELRLPVANRSHYTRPVTAGQPDWSSWYGPAADPGCVPLGLAASLLDDETRQLGYELPV